jgi:pimeloyl-ACP methyl ester carboxylesterase
VINGTSHGFFFDTNINLNFAPQLGVAWDPKGKGNTVLRAGIGALLRECRFRAATIHSSEGAEIFVRSGGKGPVVVLVHGYAENSDSWGPLAADLMKDHTVVVPDLRGIGRSSKPETGYDKRLKPRTSGQS